MFTKEQLKKYFWYFFSTLGVVFFWAGTWDGIGHISFLKIPWVSLGIGIILLSISGIIFKDETKLAEKTAHSVLSEVHHHPQREQFHIKYNDKIKKQHITIRADQIKSIEKGFLVLEAKKGVETFVPIHRVTEILHQGKSYKKLHTT